MADEESVFHAGEQDAQERAGMRERIEQIGPILIRDVMPDQHRELFQQLPMLIVGSLDQRRRPWASVLIGKPGFITSPDARTLRVGAWPLPGDPLAAHLVAGAPLGLLGIEFKTRRRNRMNGVVGETGADAFTVGVQQSFGNCPKYIQARTPHWIAEPATFGAPRPVRREGSAISADARALIQRADTFFIATAAPDGTAGRAGGVDVSHRGGRPGFVHVTDAPTHTALTVPDFVGNYMFNTVGNLVLNPRAGLLFVDFERGDLLGLTADVTIVWEGPEVQAFPGAQRVLRCTIAEGWGVERAVPLRWSTPEFSPHL